jgi:hypothetical protein
MSVMRNRRWARVLELGLSTLFIAKIVRCSPSVLLLRQKMLD